MPEKYPGKWYYDEENKWITRETSEEDGEVWCEFSEPPEEDGLFWLLELINALYEVPDAVPLRLVMRNVFDRQRGGGRGGRGRGIMNVIEFHRKGSNKPEVFSCGKCGKHWASGMHPLLGKTGREIAEGCCEPGVCNDCGRDELPEFWTRCSECSDKARYEAADKINDADYIGALEWEGEFYRDSDELYNSLDEERPEYAYACEERKGSSYDYRGVIENLIENTYEDFEVKAQDELKEFFEQWNKKQDQEWWMSTERIVLLDWDSVSN